MLRLKVLCKRPGRRAYSSGQPQIWLPRRFARIGIALGVLCCPLAAVKLYERFDPLPSPLDLPFSWKSRYYIRRAMWSDELTNKAYYLDQAMRAVLNSGYGAASPQSTALVLYLSQLYLDAPTPEIGNLMASHAALTHKPHVGEGVKEERARLEMSFTVANRLCDLLAEVDPDAAREYATKSLNTMERAPPFLGNSIRNHPLRDRFRRIVEKK